MCDLTNPIFNDVTAARKHLESLRWADGRFCPHCGEAEKTSPVRGKKHRTGLYYCNGCKKQFTVTIGTVFERSHIPLNKWLLAFHLMNASKKGISAHQLHRMLGITYKSAWFMAHRIREAMIDENPEPMGGPGKSVQADETYFGNVENPRSVKTDGTAFTKGGKSGPSNKRAVVALVSEGKARTFHVKTANAATAREILVSNVKRETELHTDESRIYTKVGEEYAAHKTVNHSKGEYVRPDGMTTNNVENYFSVFKRGMKGVYQHCAEKHLQRYLCEFDFRYNNREINDAERTAKALKGIEGKRLTYRRTSERAYV
jgi:transposase-like protein